jgi:hypothetical protein
MRAGATSRWFRRGWLTAAARQVVLLTLLSSLLTGWWPCLEMAATAPTPSHCAKHGNGSQLPRKAPPQDPCKKVPELCCIVKAPAVTSTNAAAGSIVFSTRHEIIDPTRAPFLMAVAIPHGSSTSPPALSILRI